MNSIQLITKLKLKITDIDETVKALFSDSQSLSLIEKELLKKQAIELFELIMKLKTDAAQEKTNIINELNDKPIAEEILPETKVAETITSAENEVEQPQIQETITPINQPTVTETTENIAVSVEPETKEEEHIIEESTEPTEIFQTPEKIFDKAVERVENKRIQYTVMPPAEVFRVPAVKPQNETINERLSKVNQNQTIEPKIENLKTAITLNLKIAFVNELFKENVVEYAKAIDRLNNADSYHEALNILSEYKELYNWTAGNELLNELEKLVKRRYKQ